MRIIHRVTECLPNSKTVARLLKPVWSGIYIFDGKYVRVFDQWSDIAKSGKVQTKRHPGEGVGDSERIMPRHWSAWLCGIDHGTGDLPHYAMASEETKIDLVLHFQGLQEIEYPLNVLVSDGNPDILAAARKVFGESFIYQRCTKHFIDGLLRLVAQEKNVEQATNTEKLIRLIQSVVTAPDLETAGRRLTVLPHMVQKSRIQKHIVKLFHLHKDALTAHIQYPNLHIPLTSNEIENLFRQVNLRLKILNQFRHWKNAENYFKAWALLRRFTPFTDSRGDRKVRNGKAPLTLAGVDLTHVDMFSFGSKSPMKKI